MKASEFETSNYLNAKSAGQYNGETLTIYEVKSEIVRENKKLVIGFESVEKLLIVNKTNRNALADAFGDETNDWLGRKVICHLTRVMYDGNLTPSIVLEPVTRLKPGIQTTAPGQPHEPAPVIDADKPTKSKAKK
jgi:hypothetical protein